MAFFVHIQPETYGELSVGFRYWVAFLLNRRSEWLAKWGENTFCPWRSPVAKTLMLLTCRHDLLKLSGFQTDSPKNP